MSQWERNAACLAELCLVCQRDGWFGHIRQARVSLWQGRTQRPHKFHTGLEFTGRVGFAWTGLSWMSGDSVGKLKSATWGNAPRTIFTFYDLTRCRWIVLDFTKEPFALGLSLEPSY